MKKARNVILIALSVIIMISAAACLKGNKQQGSASSKGVSAQAGGTTQPGNPTQTEKPTAAPSESPQGTIDLKDLLNNPNTGNNYGWECVFTYQGTSSSYTYHIKGNKERLAFDTGELGSMILYIDGDTKTTYMYDSKTNSAIAIKDDNMENAAMKPDEFLYNLTQGDLSGYKKKGRQNVEGMDCTVYEYQYENSLIRIYVSEKYQAAVKMEGIVDGKVESSYLLKNYQVGTVTDDMVTLPKGAKITDLSSFGG